MLAGALYFAPGSLVPFVASAIVYAFALPFAYRLRGREGGGRRSVSGM